MTKEVFILTFWVVVDTLTETLVTTVKDNEHAVLRARDLWLRAMPQYEMTKVSVLAPKFGNGTDAG